MSTTETPFKLDDLLAEAVPEHKDADDTVVPFVPETRVTTTLLTGDAAEAFHDKLGRACPYHTFAVGPVTHAHEWRWATEDEARAGHAEAIATVRKVEGLPAEATS